MTAELLALLDELDAAREKATSGEWEKVGRYRIDTEGDVLARVDRPADAALIVAAVNNLPKLTAALRAVLELADAMDTYAGERHKAAADGIRWRLAAALTPEQEGEARHRP